MWSWLESTQNALWVFGLDLIGIVAAIVAAIFSMWNWFLTKRREFSNKLPRADKTSETAFTPDAVIFTVSASELPIHALKVFYKTPVVGFVHSAKSHKHMTKIRDYAREAGIKVLPPHELEDIHDPNQCRDAVAGLILQASKGRSRAGVFVDITGGKTTMSVGAYQAAVDRGATVVYTEAESEPDGETWRVKKDTVKPRRIHQPTARRR